MILCLDVGNSQIYGGVFKGSDLVLQFRRTSKVGASSDELGVFLRGVLRENSIDPTQIKYISVCSVVPEVDHSLRNCCRKYFDITPFFLQPGVRTGLRIRYHNPAEVGADRVANALAAIHMHPDQDMIIVDLGTATTFCAVSRQKDYLGGAIIAGLRISMEALVGKTAKLPSVELIKPQNALGKSTVESIQNGLYYGKLGAIRELCNRITDEVFGGQRPLILGTGGLASLFEGEGIFDQEVSDLVLRGLFIAYQMNALEEK